MTHFKSTLLICTALIATACQTAPKEPNYTPPPTTIPVTKIEADKPATPKLEVPQVQLPTLRIKAGSETPVTDSKGDLWLADTGFEGGANADRADATVTGTNKPELYKTEHHSMTSWSTKLPSGDYTLKLHFAENYSGVTDENGRVFTITVLDGPLTTGKTLSETKDFSIWKMAGGGAKAYVLALPITITTGELSIKFTEQTQHPEINAIEITPATPK